MGAYITYIDHPLGFVIGRLNTSASLYRIAPCLIIIAQSCSNIYL